MGKKQSGRKTRARLAESQATGSTVRIHRRHTPEETTDGIVLETGGGLVLLATLRELAYPNGYTVLRTRDITAVHRFTAFDTFVRAQGHWPPAPPAHWSGLTGWQQVLTDGAANATVVSLQREGKWPGELLIGTPVEYKKYHAWVLNIDPTARWEDTMERFRYKHITRIEFGGDYETVLLASAGPLPARSNPT